MTSFLPPTTPDRKKTTVNHNRLFAAASSPHPTTPGTTTAPPPPPTTPLLNTKMRLVSNVFKALGASEHEKREHPFIPENVTHEKLLQKHSTAIQQLRLSPAELQAVVTDDDHFHRIQQSLREMGAQTDALAQQVAPALLRAELEQWRSTQAQVALLELEQQRLEQKQQRQHEIQRELAEARIKARQALQLSSSTHGSSDDSSSTSSSEDNDDVEEDQRLASPVPKGSHAGSTTSSESPTSVMMMNTLSLSDEQLGAFKPGLEEEQSEDGDIQEVEEDF